MKLHIVAPDIRAGDAVGNHCLYLAKALRHQGLETALYARRHDPDQKVHLLEYLLTSVPLSNTDDVLLISYSTFQPRLGELMALPCRKLMYFHGVTPTELLLDHDPEAAYWSSRALLQLPLLAQCEHIIANSHWNLADLLRHLPADMPGERLSVLPPITPDMPLFTKAPKANMEPHTPVRLLTVGRLAPHKKLDDGIRMVAWLNQHGTPARLNMVGSATSPDYARHLSALSETLGVAAAVTISGHVSDEVLSQNYADADVLVSASLHEGFCIPVLEAMHMGMPVAVRYGTAASEVADGVALTFDTAEEGAAGIARLMVDQAALEKMSRAGRSRATALLHDAHITHLTDILQRL